VGDKSFVEGFLGLLFFVSLNDLSYSLSDSHSRIIATWKHQSVQKILKSQKISNLQLGGCPIHLGCFKSDSHRIFFGIDSILLAGQNAKIASHNF
jgi:hypothetical protein